LSVFFPVKIFPIFRSALFLRRCACWLAFTGLALAAPAAEPAEADTHAAQFKVLEMDLRRLEALFHQYNNLILKPSILSQIQTLTDRVEALKGSFDGAKYDELRSDINLQCQRLALAMAPLRTPPLSKEDTSRLVNVARLNPRAEDKAEVKAALDAVDVEIRRLENRVADLAKADRPAEQARIKRLKERREQLGREFTRAGWDGLVSELK
jgi:hypothetical protein